MDTIRAEIISIGDELTSGARLDTNSQWISRRLGELGIPVSFHTTVGDDLDANAEVFRTAMARAEVVVVTGGLGPTEDDLTRAALAQATERELAVDPKALAAIRSRFASRHRTMPPSNERQTLFPVGSRPIDNPHGTAPGIALTTTDRADRACHLFALPGVPAELFEMWVASVQPMIAQLRPDPRLLQQRCIKCFGVGESRLEEMLPNLIARQQTPKVGITVHQGTITLRITASGRDQRECSEFIEPTVATIHQCLGTLVFGEEDDELQHAVLRLLDRRQATVATVEWGTAGQIAAWLDETAPQGERYLGGAVVRSAHAAVALLGGDSLGQNAGDGPEMSEMVRHLCLACRRRTGADYALATGPLSDTSAKGNRPFTVAVAMPDDEAIVESFRGVPHPSLRRVLRAKQALNVLRLQLLAKA